MNHATNQEPASLRKSLNRTRKGFTLVEIMMAMVIFTIVIAALFSTIFLALKLYYINSDYLEIGGQTRRLVDDMIETGTFADDFAVFKDITNQTIVEQAFRGDLLMFFTRSTDGNAGNIKQFTCYYLDRTAPPKDKPGPLSVWRFVGTCPTVSDPLAPAGTPPKLDSTVATSDPKTAFTKYPRSPLKRVSSTVLNDSLPRNTTAGQGLFTNSESLGKKIPPTVLVNLPASMVARAPKIQAGSNVTLAISPRH